MHALGAHSKRECSRLARQVARLDCLIAPPFALVASGPTLCSYLKSLGVHNLDPWSALCPCTLPASSHPMEIPDLCTSVFEAWPRSDTRLWHSVEMPSHYRLLLDWPLTLLHTLLECAVSESSGSMLVAHIIGARRETYHMNIVRYFAPFLNPKIKYEFYFIGPQVPFEHAVHFENIYCCSKRGLYEDWFDVGLPRPDIIVGFNAGLAADVNWTGIFDVLFLDAQRIPKLLVFTDLNEEAARRAAKLVGHAARCYNALDTLRFSPIKINPFRQPFLQTPSDNNLPTFSNGFMFSITKEV